ncbi:MAG TPA: hybrid sensor histidine kinase/response regulator [Anaeromyxobacter sp.]|nr:hybrid sensor histidine kinase/response regulator [Anaeromyxobacter sp.]
MPQRVLCIEGDRAVLTRVKALLESEGFAVDTSESGLEGIARALTLPPDLVLADVHLPDIEGYELAARLKREHVLQRVPFVAVGASREEHDVALAAGADGFIDRSVDDHLGEEVRAFLAGKREKLPEEGEREQLRALSGTMAARLETAVAGERRASAKLVELDRLKSTFMHNLAHELSTPLTPLAGYLKILRSGKVGPLPPQHQRLLDSMQQALEKLVRVVDNLSDFASLETGQVPFLDADVDPDALVDDVVAELRRAIQEARLNVTVTHAGAGAIRADARKLRQAVGNLVANAVKFSPHGGEVLVEVLREGEKLRFAVYDQGPGVRAGEAERIFEPLYHAAARAGEDARLPGSGLGLPVARRIAEAHGGRVFLESPPRTQPARTARHFTGSKFVLEVPVRPADRPGAGGSAPPRAGGAAPPSAVG